jgi:hypothetical protein
MATKLTTMATQAHPDPGMRQLLAQLSGQRVIAFNVNLARVCGDVKAALFASQLLYWTRVGPEVQTNGGWVFKTRDQWQTETGLTRFEQESARKRLQGLALIEQARVGAPPMSCFRIVLPELGKALSSLLNQPQPQQQWSLFALRSSEAHIRQLLGRNMAYYTVFAQITDSMPAAVLLTKALALHTMVLQKSKAQAGAEWFSLTAQQWQDETGLRAAQLRLAKQKLCQLSVLQEALQTYPLRRTYWRVDIAVVSRLLTTQLSATSTNLFGRILAMAQGVSAQQAEHKGATEGSGEPKQDSGSQVPTDTKRSTPLHQTITSSATEGCSASERRSVSLGHGETNWRSVSPGYSGPIWRTNQPEAIDPLGKAESQHHSASFDTDSSSFPHSANPDGDFSHVKRLVSAHQTAALSRTSGQLPQDMRLVSAPLHARAIQITNKTTTTTTASRVVTSSVTKPDVVVVLVWPSGMQTLQTAALTLLQSIPRDDWQRLLDELAGNMAAGNVKFPLSYLRHLVGLHKVGALIFEKADEVALSRQRAVNAQEVEAERLKRSIQSMNAIPAGMVAAQPVVCNAEAEAATDQAKQARARLEQLREETRQRAAQPFASRFSTRPSINSNK